MGYMCCCVLLCATACQLNTRGYEDGSTEVSSASGGDPALTNDANASMNPEAPTMLETGGMSTVGTTTVDGSTSSSSEPSGGPGPDMAQETTTADTSTGTTGDATTGAPVECPGRIIGNPDQHVRAFWDTSASEVVLVGSTNKPVTFGGVTQDPGADNRVMYAARISESSVEVDLDTLDLGGAGCDDAALSADGRLFAVSKLNPRLFVHNPNTAPPWKSYMLPAGRTAYGVAASATRVVVVGVCASWPSDGDRWIESRAFANLDLSVDSPCLAPKGVAQSAHLANSKTWLAGDQVGVSGRDAVLHKVVFPNGMITDLVSLSAEMDVSHVFHALAGDADTVYAVGRLGGGDDVVDGTLGDLAFASIGIDGSNPRVWSADIGVSVTEIRTLAVHGESLYFAGISGAFNPFVGRISKDGVGSPIMAPIAGLGWWYGFNLDVDVSECGLLLSGHVNLNENQLDLMIAGQTAMTVEEAEAGNTMFAVFLPFDF